ncbi:MAG: asparagine synthase (glutamine-hydrolyzing) [Nitrososphaerales archaeon]
MCGIAGIVGDYADKHLVKKMLSILQHRGPDSQGVYVDDKATLGACRLAVIDLVSGDQPMSSEEGDVTIVYNGEVYNYKSLRRRLEEKGHRFKTSSDTEVLIHAYEEFGDAFVDRLNGMFAFAIWDKGSKRLLLGRDPVGVKPLYYMKINGGCLAFASEAKAFLYLREPRCDRVALKAALNLGYVSGERCMFEGVKRLKAGYLLSFQNGEVEVKQYWNLEPDVDFGLTLGDAASAVRRLIKSAVESHMVSDVPIGAFLSGGLDTSTVVALMSRVSGSVKTFTLGFAEPTDELADAKRVAEYFGTEHHDLILDEESLIKEYPSMVWHAEAPKINLYPYFVSKLASRFVKVVLGGMGGDELFGGYIYRYRHIKRAETVSKTPIYPLLKTLARTTLILNPALPIRVKRRLKALTLLKDRVRFFLLLHSPELLEEYVEEYAPYFKTKQSFLEQAMLAEFKTKLVDDLLLVDDAMTMAHSLEERVPLLDRSLVEYAFKIPVNLKVGSKVGKIVLREAVKDLLPKYVLDKPKWGFSIDVKHWYTKSIYSLSQQLFDDSSLFKHRLIDLNYIKRLLSKTKSSLEVHEARYLWLATLAEMWFRIFVEHQGDKGALKL